MRIMLGLRIAFAGGRQSLARVALMTGGVAVGVVLLLLALTAMPALQGRIDRYAWHRTEAATPATAPDRALWLAITDRYAGQNIVRVHIAPLGPRPPVPPGLDRLPAAGEMVVSPALSGLLRSVPRDQLGDRFPGRVTGTIRPEGLVSPDELVAIVGHTPEQVRAMVGAYEIRGFERPAEAVDLGVLVLIQVTLLAVLLLLPVVVLIALVTRVGAARREQRLAAIRLAGATRWQTAVLAATETTTAAIAGVLAGWSGYVLARPVVAEYVRLEGVRFPLEDVAVPASQVAVVLVAVPLIVVAATLVALHRVQITPLGVHRRARRRPPRARRLAPIAAGILGLMAVDNAARAADDGGNGAALSFVAAASLLSILVGIVLTGPWLCMWISRGLARLSRRATTLMAARRIAADPYAASHAVIAVALAVFVATPVAVSAEVASDAPRTVLNPAVVAVQVAGAAEKTISPYLSDRVVVARSGPDRSLVLPCADLARVTTVTCPPPVELGERGPYAALFYPNGFVEPGPNADRLPIDTIFLPTDGTRAAEERIRTEVARTMPHAKTRTYRDYVADGRAPQPIDAELYEAASAGTESMLPIVLLFVILVAACSLTVSAIAGLMERRRPFALLRASGVGLRELRWLALLETAVPLAFTVLGGMGTVLFTVFMVAPDNFAWPSPGFFLGVGAAVLATLAVCMITWPLMEATTRHDNVRFE
jgi:hypothetical protein